MKSQPVTAARGPEGPVVTLIAVPLFFVSTRNARRLSAVASGRRLDFHFNTQIKPASDTRVPLRRLADCPFVWTAEGAWRRTVEITSSVTAQPRRSSRNASRPNRRRCETAPACGTKSTPSPSGPAVDPDPSAPDLGVHLRAATGGPLPDQRSQKDRSLLQRWASVNSPAIELGIFPTVEHRP